MFEALPARIATRRLRDEHLLDEVFTAARDGVELIVVEVEFTFNDFLKDLFLVFSLEGQVAADQGVEDDATRPNVCLLSVRSLDHLRGHVVGRACHIVKPFLSLR